MPRKLERCVKKVRAKSKKVNPYTVCAKSTGWVRAKGGRWRNKKTGETWKRKRTVKGK